MSLLSKRALIFNLIFLQSIFGKRKNHYIVNCFFILIGSLSLALSSQYKVPIGPVPITLQSLVVMLIGLLYGWRLGAATVIAYWCEGIAVGSLFFAIPWFANGSGFSYFVSAPSAGFLWGFLPMVVLTGLLLNDCAWKNSFLKACGALILGQGALYFCGIFYGYLFVLPVVDWMNSTSELFAIFMFPYLFGDALKTLIVALLTVQLVRVSSFKG